MGNTICIESEPTYLLRLDRHSSFGSNASSNGAYSSAGPMSTNRSNPTNNNNYYNNYPSNNSDGGYNSNNNNSGMNSARSGASSVPAAAFDGFDHNIKTIGIERRDGRLQYRFPDIGSCVSSVQDWRNQSYDMSHMALVVIRVSRKPADNKDFVISANDTVSLYSWASLSGEVFTPRGLAEPRSVDLPSGVQWRAAAASASQQQQSRENSPLTLSLYLLRGKRAHPKAVIEALFILNRIERTFVHDQIGLQELFYNRLSGAYPVSLNYMHESWDAPTGQEAIAQRNSNHLLKAFLGKLNSVNHLGKRTDSFNEVVMNNNVNSHQHHQRQFSNLSQQQGNNNQHGGSHSRNVSGGNLNINLNNNNKQENIRENVTRLADLTVLKNNMESGKNNNYNDKNESEIKRCRTGGDFSQEVAQANAEIQQEQEEQAQLEAEEEQRRLLEEEREQAQPLSSNKNDANEIRKTSSSSTAKPPSTVMDNLSAAQRSSLTLNISSADKQAEEEDQYPVDDREMRLRRAAPQAAEVLPGLFVGGEMPSRNRTLLKSKKITHIINCASSMLENKFPEDFEYTALSLSDSADEQIQFLFPHVVEIIDHILEIQRGRVLVHCHQGVSRSCTFVIAYVMWKRGLPYNSAFKIVREKRDVCSPNAGFMCNLMRWEDMLANAAKFALIEFGPYRKDMQWPYIWRVRLPDHASGSGNYFEDQEEKEKEKEDNNGGDAANKTTSSGLTEVEIDSRSCAAVVSFEERATTAKFLKGAQCGEELAADAIERLQSWVLFGNFSNSGASSSHYLLVEYLNIEDNSNNNSNDENTTQNNNDLEIIDFSLLPRENNDAAEPLKLVHDAGYYSLLLKSKETKEFTENLLSTDEDYSESKDKYLQEQARLAKLRGVSPASYSASSSPIGLSSSLPKSGHRNNNNNSMSNSQNINANNQQHNNQQQQHSSPSSALPLPPSSSGNSNNNRFTAINTGGSGSNSSSQNNLHINNKQGLSIGGSSNNNNSNLNFNNNAGDAANTVSSTTNGGVSPDASQEIRSSNNNANAALAGGFVALRAPLWDPVGEHDLLDFDDFDPEEVYLFFIKPRSGQKTGKIYLWVGEDSGWSDDSCLNSYQQLTNDATNDPQSYQLVSELLKQRSFEKQQVTIIREREEPDDFVALF